MKEHHLHTNYAQWLKAVKERVRMARVKVALSANQALLQFYGGNKFFPPDWWKNTSLNFNDPKILNRVCLV